MAAVDQGPERPAVEEAEEEIKKDACSMVSSYVGLSFSLFLALLPANSLNVIPDLHARITDLSLRLRQAEEHLRLMKSRRKEDSKANARVVEIFSTHRNAWQAEERRLLQQIDAVSEEAASLRSRLRLLEKEREECRERIHDLEMTIAAGGGYCDNREYYDGEEDGEGVEQNVNAAASAADDDLFYAPSQYSQHNFLDSSGSTFWTQRTSPWQDVQYEPLESLYSTKHFVPRRESPWKVYGESAGVTSKLKLLEDELLNLEKVGKTDVSNVPSLMRKQAKRYHALIGKIDDLCRKMQSNDPSDVHTVSPEFRTQRQTEFLLEGFRLQQRASEIGQKLMALQTEIGKSYHGDELGCHTNLAMKRSFESIRNNLREIQRNLEIWLARIIGDLEGILARDGASQAREYYLSRYPFLQ